MKAWNFASRNIKEILRDPLGIIFCVIFPVAMIGMFQLIGHYTPDAYWFNIDVLMPGIIVFAFAFVMLYMAILVSKDRTTGVNLSFGGVLLNFAVDLPVIVVMTAIGILFGSILSDKSAPGVSSAIITISAVLGGAWMPLETMGSLETVCKFLPWYPATCMGRMAVSGEYEGFWMYLVTDIAYAVVISVLAVIAIKKMMVKDNK